MNEFKESKKLRISAQYYNETKNLNKIKKIASTTLDFIEKIKQINRNISSDEIKQIRQKLKK
ncbi:hypothetical protein HN587_03685 [Candidatus Woesearchaeota archaeon]|jgi:hypothetical protein|nr:hypothetical protein [Candidatus Woesearchaeota archaeon]